MKIFIFLSMRKPCIIEKLVTCPLRYTVVGHRQVERQVLIACVGNIRRNDQSVGAGALLVGRVACCQPALARN